MTHVNAVIAQYFFTGSLLTINLTKQTNNLMTPLEKQFLEQLTKRRLVQRGDKVLLAVSGGPDSMALLSLFCSVQPFLQCSLALAHCNFQLRDSESDSDEAFVQEQATARNLPCFVERFETRNVAATWKKSLEESARLLRYAFFERLMQEHGFHKVATGHHVNDNAETILFNLVRGTSLLGLRGIRAQHGTIIRPMLLLHKHAITTYLHEQQIPYRVDSSNEGTEYDRNFIRHRLIPLIEERFPRKLLPSLQRLSEQAGELEEFLELYFEQLTQREPLLQLHNNQLNVKALQKLTSFEQKEIIKRALWELGAPVDGQTLQRMVELLQTQSGRMVQLGRKWQVEWKGNSLYFSHQP
jgi:tRNA(Ile)-lysidine synthase